MPCSQAFKSSVIKCGDLPSLGQNLHTASCSLIPLAGPKRLIQIAHTILTLCPALTFFIHLFYRKENQRKSLHSIVKTNSFVFLETKQVESVH